MTAVLFDLTGRPALVTGASRGLGRHFALTLARAGARVALAARRVGRLEAVRREDGVVATNLKDAWPVPQAAARHRSAHGRGGNIVNIASITGLRAAGGVSAYAASKAGLFPQRRLGHAGKLDGALLLLASDAGSCMSGSTLVVDGGHLQSSP